MRRIHAWLLVSTLSASLFGCGKGDGKGDGAGAGGTPGTDGGTLATQIAFLDPAPLIYVPGDVRTLTVKVTPPFAYTVRFSLVGDPRDAFLDQGQAPTTSDGTARLELTAPTSPSSFGIRASTEDVYTVLEASPGTSFGKVEVKPVYTGSRPVTTWTATIRTGLGCAAAGVPPPDGPLRTSAAPGAPLVIDNVPAATPVTVTVRAGHFAGGCAELTSVAAGRTTSVNVSVVDRPLQLGALNLPVALRLDLTQAVIDAGTSLATEMATSLEGGAANDVAALLDAMAAGLDPATSGTFATLRTAKGWDAQVAAATTFGPDGLRKAVARYVVGGLPSTGSVLISGTLSATTPTAGTLTVTDVAGFSPQAAGFGASFSVSLSAESDDRVLFGGSVPWEPGTLAGARALAPALLEVPGATTVPEALASVAQCGVIATTLVDASTGFAYGACDAACVQSDCMAALARMWARAVAIEAVARPMELAESGRATSMDDTAHPTRVDGSWVGTTTAGSGPVTLSGSSLLGTGP